MSLIKLSIAHLAVAAGAFSCTVEEPKNVLFISVDDMNNDLGCFGNPVVKSPGIDRLASGGIAFANAYCQFPLSSPSRSSVLTGLRPDKTRVFDLTYHFRQNLPDINTLPQLFMNNGYYVARVGKMFHYGNPNDIGTNGLDDKLSWKERYNPLGLDKSSLEDDVINYTPNRGLGASVAWYSDPDGADTDHTDGKVADQAIELLRNHGKEPFFIAAGFYRPHTPYISPAKYFNLYDPGSINIQELKPETSQYYPANALASTTPWPLFGITNEQAMEAKLAYYAAISFVDAQINRLLDAVETLGLADNTIIVFWSDHGYHLGEHGLWFKQSCFEESAKCPLIISFPGIKTAGKICRKTVELVDIYPTVAGLAGLTPPPDIEGLSLVPLLEDPEADWEHPAYTQVQRKDGPGHSVRTEKWRYTEWAFGEKGTELYDEISDPKELKNLAGDPEYAGVVKEMKALLKNVHPVPVTGGKAVKDTKERFCN